jgi:hypothetical protein
MLVIGRRVWRAIAIAAFAVNLPIGPSPLGAAVIAAGNTLAPLASVELLRRVGFHREFSSASIGPTNRLFAMLGAPGSDCTSAGNSPKVTEAAS